MGNINFKIVKDLPIPQRRPGQAYGRSPMYPFFEMEIGDCLKFEASSTRDLNYRRLYNSARSHTRRKDCPYEFKFAQLGEGTFGCWKVSRNSPESQVRDRRRRRTAAEINSIPVESIREALHSEGTVAGAARRVGLSPRTFIRMVEKLSLKQ